MKVKEMKVNFPGKGKRNTALADQFRSCKTDKYKSQKEMRKQKGKIPFPIVFFQSWGEGSKLKGF